MRIKTCLTSVILLTGLILTSCDRTQSSGMTGVLYFASGSYIGKYDLASRKSSIVANIGNVSIRDIEGFNDSEILLVMDASIGKFRKSLMSTFDTQTSKRIDMTDAVAVAHLPETNWVIFDTGEQLKATRLIGLATRTVLIDEHKRRDLRALVAISGDEVLYETGNGHERQIQKFSISSRHISSLPQLSRMCSLKGALWISESRQLACAKPNSPADYQFVQLDGTLVKEFTSPDGLPLRAVSYVPRYNTVIFSESRPALFDAATKHGIRALNLLSGESSLLADDHYLGQSAVYRLQ